MSRVKDRFSLARFCISCGKPFLGISSKCPECLKKELKEAEQRKNKA